MVGLTSKQRDELNSAILEYLVKNKFEQSAQHFANEASVAKDTKDNSSSSVMKDILEKKWTSIVKLKKQVMELEKLNKELKEHNICERCGEGTGIIGGDR